MPTALTAGLGGVTSGSGQLMIGAHSGRKAGAMAEQAPYGLGASPTPVMPAGDHFADTIPRTTMLLPYFSEPAYAPVGHLGFICRRSTGRLNEAAATSAVKGVAAINSGPLSSAIVPPE